MTPLFSSAYGPIPGITSANPSQIERDFERRWQEAARLHPGDLAAQGAQLDRWQFGHEVFNPPDPMLSQGSVSEPGILGRIWDWLREPRFPAPETEDGRMPRFAPRDPITAALEDAGIEHWVARGVYIALGLICITGGIIMLGFIQKNQILKLAGGKDG